jgi:hypothetical protein
MHATCLPFDTPSFHIPNNKFVLSFSCKAPNNAISPMLLLRHSS